MTALSTANIDALGASPRAVMHMRRQIHRQRFGLMLGAGTSKSLGFPDWSTLIARIADDPAVEGTSLLSGTTASSTSQTQILQQHFKSRIKMDPVMKPVLSARTPLEHDQIVQHKWTEVLHRSLYRDVLTMDGVALAQSHPYLGTFLDVIRRSPLTVNYNWLFVLSCG